MHTGACGWNCALFLGTTRRWARGNGSAGGEGEASSSVLRLVLTWKSDLTETRARGSTGRCEHCEAGGGRTLPAWKLICEVGAGRFSNVYSREGCPVHTWNPITWKVKTVGSWVQGYSGSHKTIPQKWWQVQPMDEVMPLAGHQPERTSCPSSYCCLRKHEFRVLLDK